MTQAAVVHTDLSDSAAAGRFIGRQIIEQLHDSPDALILFASPRHDFSPLLEEISNSCRPTLLVGGTSAGEFTRDGHYEGSACAVALRSPDMRFTAGIGRGLRTSRAEAAKNLVTNFAGRHSTEFVHRSALVLTDALAGHADDLIDQVTILTAGAYQLCGSGAGADADLRGVKVFHGTEASSDAVVALEMLSNKPIGIGTANCWEPASAPMRVTEADGLRLISLNAVPAAVMCRRYAEATRQTFDSTFLLCNIFGVKRGDQYQLRVPLSINSDGSVNCATEMPVGATIRFMKSSIALGGDAVARSAASAISQLGDNQAKVALFFDCAVSRRRMESRLAQNVRSAISQIGPALLAGSYGIGQIVRADGQYSGFLNCMPVVCAIPE